MHPSDKSILIIEDNPDDGVLTMRALKKLNYANIKLVETGSQALDYLYNDETIEKNNHLPPDLILLDLNLPIIDGFTILKKIRSSGSTKHTPVIVLTSSGEDKDINKSYDLGANSYIQKPVDFIEFEKAAVLISEYWLTLNVPPV
ncbi:response regulator [Rhodohalobacter sp. 8-1]|uniref:response regulator n=1 Tax=Rhodohalobacter sp. 8-1 TaxID=3131972 RepID=UPI0030EB5B89